VQNQQEDRSILPGEHKEGGGEPVRKTRSPTWKGKDKQLPVGKKKDPQQKKGVGQKKKPPDMARRVLRPKGSLRKVRDGRKNGPDWPGGKEKASGDTGRGRGMEKQGKMQKARRKTGCKKSNSTVWVRKIPCQLLTSVSPWKA